jgi:hypothetical protein
LDLTIQRVLPHIDGVAYLARIAAASGVDLELVKKATRLLLYHGYIKMIDVFQYSNVYVPTRRLDMLYRDSTMQQQAVRYVAWDPSLPAPSHVLLFRLYAGLQRGLRMAAVCTNEGLQERNIDARKWVIFGLANGLIRRVHKYPLARPSKLDEEMLVEGGQGQQPQYGPQPEHLARSSATTQWDADKSQGGAALAALAVVDRTAPGRVSYYDGAHSYDEICCALGKSYTEVDSDVRSDPHCVVLSR